MLATAQLRDAKFGHPRGTVAEPLSMPSDGGSQGVSNPCRIPRGTPTKTCNIKELAPKIPEATLRPAVHPSRSWTHRVPRVRILPVRQDHLREPALRLHLGPLKPGNSAILRKWGVDLEGPEYSRKLSPRPAFSAAVDSAQSVPVRIVLGDQSLVVKSPSSGFDLPLGWARVRAETPAATLSEAPVPRSTGWGMSGCPALGTDYSRLAPSHPWQLPQISTAILQELAASMPR
jgi:hypothetical protein